MYTGGTVRPVSIILVNCLCESQIIDARLATEFENNDLAFHLVPEITAVGTTFTENILFAILWAQLFYR